MLLLLLYPPQTIISLSVQTAVWRARPAGALMVLVAFQLSVMRSYRPPVLNRPLNPPQHDHLTVCPNCRVIISARGRVRSAGGYPTIRTISTASVHIDVAVKSAPDDHFAARQNCRVASTRLGRVDGAGRFPAISDGIISAARVKNAAGIKSAPNDHLAASPNCRVSVSAIGRVGRAGGCPAISAGIVSPAGVQVSLACTCIRPRRSFH